jgi:hypothetical protein
LLLWEAVAKTPLLLPPSTAATVVDAAIGACAIVSTLLPLPLRMTVIAAVDDRRQ